MKTRSFYPVLLAVFAIGSVLCQNEEELPIPVETDNQFPPEYSESDGHSADSETTAAEHTQPTLGSTTDISVSTLTEEDEQVIDGASETTTLEPTQTIPGSIITDEAAAPILTSRDDQDAASEGIDTIAAEPTQTTFVSTITDIAASTLVNVDEIAAYNKGSDTTAAEPTKTTSESTIADVTASAAANDDDEVTIKEGETTDAKSTETTSDSTIVDLAANDDEQVTNNKGSETTAAETTYTTSGSTLVDVAVPMLVTQNEEDNNNEDSETTAAEPTKLTLRSITADEHVTYNEVSETEKAEPTQTMSESTTSDELLLRLTSPNGQVTNNEGSEITLVEHTESTPESPNEVVDSSNAINAESSCPGPCTCITEGDSSNYIVDCSGHGLTDLPTPIDPKTTILKLQNNQLTVIPKAISDLKNLKNLNANDNLISELESGSISELPNLVSLKLTNNRFLEYPIDLENASMDKLEELDLSGNEFKTTPEIFLNFKALRTVTLPEISSELVSQLCTSLKETLVNVCTKSCTEHSYECSDVSVHSKDNSFDATLPGMIPFFHEIVKEDIENSDDILANSEKSDTTKTSSNSDAAEQPPSSATKETPEIMPLPEIPSTSGAKEVSGTSAELSTTVVSSNSRRKESSEMPPKPTAPDTPSVTKDNLPINDFSLRTAVNNVPQEKVALQNIVIETPKESLDNATDVKVGAKTETQRGGVDKSVIAVIVAGMVIVVAVIAIKKNWSSIRKRFSSTPRSNDISGRNTNGTTVTPEEVPLQDKSPV